MLLYIYIYIYCHVLGGTRDENNGFSIGWLGLLSKLFTILINYSAIANLHNSLRTCSILVLVLSTTAIFRIRFSYDHFAQIQRKKTVCIVDEACLSRRCLAMDSQFLSRAEAGKVLTKLLPSNGYPRYSIYIYSVRSRKPRLTAVGIRCADHATPSIRKSWH
jgi:hypothetical protein